MAKGDGGDQDGRAPNDRATADWYARAAAGDEVTGLRIGGETFDELDLTESRTRGVVFDGCTFRRCRFNASVHVDGAFANCEFVGCRFFDAHFDGCKFTGATFTGCEFDLLAVDRGDWRFVSLVGADLTSARFTWVKFGEADLRRIRGTGLVLRDCDLALAELAEADLTRADLRGSDLISLDPRHTIIDKAIVTPQQALTLAINLGLDVRFEEERG